MEQNSADVLFEYLRGILYERETPMLAEEAVSAECRDLVKGLNLLHVWLKESADFAKSIAAGQLKENEPSRENPLCDSLKMLHSSLSHLSWQTKQIAGGDYSQKVAMLGDFSESFNTMTQQLKLRENVLFQRNELLTCIADNIEEAVVVLAKDTGELLYGNKALLDLITDEVLSVERIRALLKEDQEDTPRSSWEKQLEIQDRTVYAQIISIQIYWREQNAQLYLLRNITEQKERELAMKDEANTDVMTGLHNRRYCMKKLERLIRKRIPFSLCFMDLDHLKFVNDNYGHEEGDAYIQLAAGLLKKFFRSNDILCRIGGDEFVIIMPKCPKKCLRLRMEEVYSKLLMQSQKAEYAMSASYGIEEYDGSEERSVEEILEKADARMYAFKLQHREHEEARGESL